MPKASGKSSLYLGNLTGIKFEREAEGPPTITYRTRGAGARRLPSNANAAPDRLSAVENFPLLGAHAEFSSLRHHEA
jgi:hypothetical protein